MSAKPATTICVFCKEEVKKDAEKCKHCHEMIMLNCYECGKLTRVEDGFVEERNVLTEVRTGVSASGVPSFGARRELRTVLICKTCQPPKKEYKYTGKYED